MPSNASSDKLRSGLDRLAEPDEVLLDVATEASLKGLNLHYDIEVAIQNPRNRDAIAKALRAAHAEITKGRG